MTTFRQRRAAPNPARDRDLLKPTLRGVTEALVLVALTYFASQAGGEELVARPEFGSGPAKEIEIWTLLLATAALGGLGGLLLAGLARRLPGRGRLAFLAASAVGLIVYGALAVSRTDSLSTAVWLNLMHLAAAAPIVGRLASVLRERCEHVPPNESTQRT